MGRGPGGCVGHASCVRGDGAPLAGPVVRRRCIELPCFFPLLYAVSAHARAPWWPNAALGVGLAGCGLTLARPWGFTGAPIDAWSWWLMLGTTALGGTIAAWALGRYRVNRAAWADQLAERVARKWERVWGDLPAGAAPLLPPHRTTLR